MASFSLIVALGTAVLASLFSGFPGPLPIVLFAALLVLNCECMAANVCEDDKTSVLFMAVISSSLVVLLTAVLVSNNLNIWLCDLGLQDPEKVHPLVPCITFVSVIGLYLFLLKQARKNRLLVQKCGASLQSTIDRHTYNPKLKRIKRIMIQEGTLSEFPDENEE